MCRLYEIYDNARLQKIQSLIHQVWGMGFQHKSQKSNRNDARSGESKIYGLYGRQKLGNHQNQRHFRKQKVRKETRRKIMIWQFDRLLLWTEKCQHITSGLASVGVYARGKFCGNLKVCRPFEL